MRHFSLKVRLLPIVLTLVSGVLTIALLPALSAPAAASGVYPGEPMWWKVQTNHRCSLGTTPEKPKKNIKLSSKSVKLKTTPWLYGKTEWSRAKDLKTDTYNKNRVRRVDRQSSCKRVNSTSTGRVQRIYVPDRYQHRLRYNNFACGGGGCRRTYSKQTKWAKCYVGYETRSKSDGKGTYKAKRKVC